MYYIVNGFASCTEREAFETIVRYFLYGIIFEINGYIASEVVYNVVIGKRKFNSYRNPHRYHLFILNNICN